jgi:putative transposase
MPSRTKRPSLPGVTQKRYPTDLTDTEWERIKPLLPRSPIQDGKPTIDLREVVNALRFKSRITGGWSMLPTGFGSREVIHWWFRRLLRRLLLRIAYDRGTLMQEGHTNRAAAVPIVSQPRRKGRIVIDGHGRLHLDKLTVTDMNKGSGSQAILDAIIKRQPWVKHLLGDGSYDRGTLVSKTVLLEFLHEVVRRMAVEQTVGHATPETVAGHNAEWLTRWRSVVRRYEARLDISDMPAWPWEKYVDRWRTFAAHDRSKRPESHGVSRTQE